MWFYSTIFSLSPISKDLLAALTVAALIGVDILVIAVGVVCLACGKLAKELPCKN